MSEALKKAREAMKARREAGEKVVHRTPIQIHNEDPMSKAKAIKAMCYHCMGGDDADNWRKEVANCTSLSCPLFPVRPCQPNKKEE